KARFAEKVGAGRSASRCPPRGEGPGAGAVGEAEPVVLAAPEEQSPGGALGGLPGERIVVLVLQAVAHHPGQALGQSTEAGDEGAGGCPRRCGREKQEAREVQGHDGQPAPEETRSPPPGLPGADSQTPQSPGPVSRTRAERSQECGRS
ncbi:MAG: hypothetical protein C4294_08800, partial [Nitrospiraceae bacterium]